MGAGGLGQKMKKVELVTAHANNGQQNGYRQK